LILVLTHYIYCFFCYSLRNVFLTIFEFFAGQMTSGLTMLMNFFLICLSRIIIMQMALRNHLSRLILLKGWFIHLLQNIHNIQLIVCYILTLDLSSSHAFSTLGNIASPYFPISSFYFSFLLRHFYHFQIIFYCSSPIPSICLLFFHFFSATAWRGIRFLILIHFMNLTQTLHSISSEYFFWLEHSSSFHYFFVSNFFHFSS